MKLSFHSKFSLRKNGHLFGYGNGPDSDWRVVFFVLSVFIIIIIGFGLLIFYKVNTGSLFAVTENPDTQELKLKTSLLDKTISYYQDRASTTEKIKVSKEVIKDPSI